MPKKKKETNTSINVGEMHAEVIEQPIVQTLETNYMPYVMSVILSRAIPEIDGFKPAHRKLLYTMYKMGLLTGARTKSANIVGQTMRLNPHGDGPIYETMVRLSRGCEALLHPFVDSKGNFGKAYSRDMAYAASRYTEAKLDAICNELFRDIDSDTVDFVDNYDNTMKEPSLLPSTFPNLLVSSNMGIAVGMASNICGFNLSEVCKTTIALIKDENHDIMSTLHAPDFSSGAELIYNVDEIAAIYGTGKGSFKLRARWRYEKSDNLIEIYEIPYTTTVEAIIDKVAKLVKDGKMKEISDMRDETDLNGLKLTIDLKRGTDPDKLMQKLFTQTTLMDSFACNFNILISGVPKVMGVREILSEWTAWRTECVKRRVYYTLNQKKDKLHLLNGLKKILLDIDKAIKIIRETEHESEVVPNLMIGFGIDELQADYIAEIRLRNINKEYILKRVEETTKLEDEIADLEDTLGSKRRIQSIIVKELEAVDKKYSIPRKTLIIYDDVIEPFTETDQVEDYPVHLFMSRGGYFKKITPLSLRMGGEQKYKEGDEAYLSYESSNSAEILVFTNKQQVYKARAYEFDDTKASVLGDYLPTKLKMDEGETALYMLPAGGGHFIFFFENGKAARVDISAYETKSNRKRLTGAYSDKSPLVDIMYIQEETELALTSTEGRAMIFSTSLLAPKTTRSSQGVAVMTLKGKNKLASIGLLKGSAIKNPARYRARNIPAAGALLKPEDLGNEQLTINN